ncbi:class I adenylate-forming enzyme family protein [Streptomyces sp. NRRL B-24572]|uniref:class I adenylate-forming enzyme family protein n=1 Tax=Streptomyces sp. NRRL B-24572 TaxID=1962156 RepID=UPI000A38FDE4|nr:AMP-binding protein [Streptomyces sp. NRRL B-24572]
MSDHTPTTTGPGFVGYPQAVLDALARDPDRPAIICHDRRQVTAGELRGNVHRLARELTARGVRRGQTVALLTGNTPQALIARYAANLSGARVTPLYDGLSPDVLAHLVDDVETELLLADSTRSTDLERLRPLVRVPTVATLGPSPHTDDICAAAARRPSAPVIVPVGDDDDWCIRHTGGTTTGLPKGLQMKHGPYRRTLDVLCAPSKTPPRYLACTPLTHVAGLCADLALLQGGEVVLQPAFDAGEVLAAIERERITHLWLLPPLLHQILDHPALPTTDISSVQRITYGGSPASPARLRQTENVFGKVLHSWYGQNETLGLTEVHPEEHGVTGRHGQITVGRALPGVELSIRDRHGDILPTGSEGEIHARAHSMMNGYWKQPELTARVLRDGWVRTGDIGYLDDDGYLFLADRSHDTITIEGARVYPSEIEAVLTAHPAVAQCAVFGVRHEDTVEHVHAAIVPAHGHTATGDELRAYVTTHKSRLHAPHAFHVMKAIPLTSIGKPDKHALRRALQ